MRFLFLAALLIGAVSAGVLHPPDLGKIYPTIILSCTYSSYIPTVRYITTLNHSALLA